MKLLFMIDANAIDGEGGSGVERMWVIVLGRVGDDYRGVLDCQPASIEPGHLDAGTELLFKAEHVIDIDNPPRDYLLAKLGDRLRTEVAD